MEDQITQVPPEPTGPISKTRLEWIRERLQVVKLIIQELTRQRHMYGAHPQSVQSALDRLMTEKLMLQLEEEVLGQLLK